MKTFIQCYLLLPYFSNLRNMMKNNSENTEKVTKSKNSRSKKSAVNELLLWYRGY